MDKLLRQLKVEIRPIASLKPHPRNPRTHSREQIRQIKNSIETFGFTVPVLIDEEGNIIAGHGRFEALKLLGGKEVPTICLADMTEAEKHAYVLADNKLAERAGWDSELVALELAYISKLDVDFDVTLTGFETPEIDLLLGTTKATGTPEEAWPAIDPSKPTVTRLHDLWLLGPHRVLCADATMADSFSHLLEDKRAQVVFTNPSYDVPSRGNVSALESVVHRAFIRAAGDMSEAQFIAFFKTVFTHLTKYSIDGAIHFVCIDWRHAFELLSAGRDSYAELKNVCVWNKDNAGTGSFYRSKYELIFVFKKHGSAPHANNVALGRHGRNRPNVWDYPTVNMPRAGRREELAMHPTAKPIALVADAILDCSKRGAVVLDCFGGSGATLLAAQRTGRRAYLMELEPLYVDVTVRRFQAATGARAIHAQTGRSFDEIQSERGAGGRPQAMQGEKE
jgi:hypothetical protein